MSSKSKKRGNRKPQVEAKAGSPWPKRLLWIGGGVLIVGLAAIVFFSNPSLRGVPEGTEQVVVAEGRHVDGDLHADGEVPAGGAHDEIWQNCGFYDVEVRSENAVHSLEHGSVWITYEPGLADGQVSTLKDFANRLDKVLVSPVAGQGSPIIVTAWANQLEIQDAGDARLAQFVNEFEGSAAAPEPGGRCSGGVGSPSF